MLLLAACCTLAGFAQQKIKVARIGNSITFGYTPIRGAVLIGEAVYKRIK